MGSPSELYSTPMTPQLRIPKFSTRHESDDAKSKTKANSQLLRFTSRTSHFPSFWSQIVPFSIASGRWSFRKHNI